MINPSYLLRYSSAIESMNLEGAVEVIHEIYNRYVVGVIPDYSDYSESTFDSPSLWVEFVKTGHIEDLKTNIETFYYLYNEYHNDEMLVNLLLENPALSIIDGRALEIAIRKPVLTCSICYWSVYHYEMNAQGLVCCYGCR